MGLRWVPDLFPLEGKLQYLVDRLLLKSGFHDDFSKVLVYQNLRGYIIAYPSNHEGDYPKYLDSIVI